LLPFLRKIGKGGISMYMIDFFTYLCYNYYEILYAAKGGQL